MRSLLVFLCSPLVAAALLWTAFAACLDAPAGSSASLARLVVAWDPLACGEPHRIAVELDDEAGAELSASSPCSVGSLTVDVSHFGSYHGRVYAWTSDAPTGAVVPIEVMIEQPIVHWDVATPP